MTRCQKIVTDSALRGALDRWMHPLLCRDCRAARAADRVLTRGGRAFRRALREAPAPPGLDDRILGGLGISPEGGTSPSTGIRPGRRILWAAAGTAIFLLAVGVARIGWDRGLDTSVSVLRERGRVGRPTPAARIASSTDAGGGGRPADTPALPEVPMPRASSKAIPGPAALGSRGALLPPRQDRAPHPSPSTASPGDDLRYWNADLRRGVRVKDDFVQIPLPRVADLSGALLVAAVESYKREAAIVDARLFRKVTLAFKATALSDLCDRLRADTGIQLSAGRSVADEKVTLFCKEMPIRDVMRQLSRPFGYAWTRSGKKGAYRYELIQDLRSQLLEEELRDRDRNAALLALEKEIERYRPYLDLSPDEALARARTAPPAQKLLLEALAGTCWGPIQIYSRLSPRDLEALRAGEWLTFRQDPKPGEQPLPPDRARGVLQSLRHRRMFKGEKGYWSASDLTDPRGVALTDVPELRAQIMLGTPQSELGQFTFEGHAGFRNPQTSENLFTRNTLAPIAVAMSPSALRPENAMANAVLAREPALRRPISVQPEPSYRPGPSSLTDGGATDPSDGTASEPKVTSADVLEALHRATGLPIVADYYTRLYPRSALSVRNVPLFDALNHVADTMRLRWSKDASGGWLQFRSAGFFSDRLKEVPNRLLTRWAAARRQHGTLRLDDLVEIAGLPDAQLNAAEMAEGARRLYGLAEWDLARGRNLRPHLRYLAGFTPAQRQGTMSAVGLPFAKMPLGQQQQFIARALEYSNTSLQSLEELAGATLRVEYTLPGGFQWGNPAATGYTQWVVPLESGPRGKRALRPPVKAQTRAAAVQQLRQVDPRIREALLQYARRADPRLEADLPSDEAQIFPTRLNLTVIYIPGDTNARTLRVIDPDNNLSLGGG